MTLKESILVNATIGMPAVATGFVFAWYLGVMFALLTGTLVWQSQR